MEAGVCLAFVLFGVCCRICGTNQRVDRDEIRILRRLSDRIRSEQVFPFD